jgi:hypothetical protein
MELKAQDILVVLKLTAIEIRRKLDTLSGPVLEEEEERYGWESFEDMEGDEKSLSLFDEPNIEPKVHEGTWTYRSLAKDLYMSTSEVNAAVKRASKAKLLRVFPKEKKPRPIRKAVEEFLFYGVKYMLPAEKGATVRGIPTGYAAPAFEAFFVHGKEDPSVWPDAFGKIRGSSFKPIYKTVSKAVKKDVELYELLAILDIFREGRAREVEIAQDILSKRLLTL